MKNLNFFNNAKRLLFVLIAFVFLGFNSSNKKIQSSDKPFFFIQLSDPQIGFADDKHFDVETRNFETAVSEINILKPAFVVITGDLVNDQTNNKEVNEFFRILKMIDAKIPCHLVMGNHDVRGKPTLSTLERAKDLFGKDHYSFIEGNWKFIVLNSTIIQQPDSCKKIVEEQITWLKDELVQAKNPVIIFQHHPMYIDKLDETNQYHNMFLPQRQTYLDLFNQYHVKAIFTGHLHKNNVKKYNDIDLITTNATSRSFGKDSAGMRIVKVYKDHFEHTFYPLKEMPTKVILEEK